MHRNFTIHINPQNKQHEQKTRKIAKGRFSNGPQRNAGCLRKGWYLKQGHYQ
jgi:hypothetical protein